MKLQILLFIFIVINSSHCRPTSKDSLIKTQGLFTKLGHFISHHPYHVRNGGHGRLFQWSCTACKFIVGLLQDLVRLNKSETEIIHLIQEVCVKLEIEDRRVCDDLCVEFKEEVFTVFEKVALSPDEVCGLVFGNSCGHKYDPFSDWNVTFPKKPKPPPQPPKPPQPGSPTLRVLTLSDIHFDPQYKVGGNADCGEPLCCRSDNGPVAPGSSPAMKYGDYRNCDTNMHLFTSLMNRLKTETFDYILWLGDLPPHDVWKQTKNGQLAYYSWLLNTFLAAFPGVKVYSALGNHESAPVNSFPPPFIEGNDSISWLYKALAQVWTTEGIPITTVHDIEKGGYYTALVRPGLRIVSINMNYCNNQNWWLLINTTDPAQQLQWLIGVLQSAEDKGERVHIIGHIPPGNGDCLKTWSWNYYKIVNRYENTIVAQFFGHTHKDSFEIFYDDETFKRPVNMAYILPSVTPYSFINSGFRLFTIDGNYTGSSWAVLDHETFILNLTKANITDNPVWEREYSAKDAYGLSSLNPSDWDSLTKRMLKPDSKDFKNYLRYYYKSKEQSKPCDETCKRSMVCALRSARSHDPSLCKDMEVDHETFMKWLRDEKLC